MSTIVEQDSPAERSAKLQFFCLPEIVDFARYGLTTVMQAQQVPLVMPFREGFDVDFHVVVFRARVVRVLFNDCSWTVGETRYNTAPLVLPGNIVPSMEAFELVANQQLERGDAQQFDDDDDESDSRDDSEPARRIELSCGRLIARAIARLAMRNVDALFQVRIDARAPLLADVCAMTEINLRPAVGPLFHSPRFQAHYLTHTLDHAAVLLQLALDRDPRRLLTPTPHATRRAHLIGMPRSYHSIDTDERLSDGLQRAEIALLGAAVDARHLVVPSNLWPDSAARRTLPFADAIRLCQRRSMIDSLLGNDARHLDTLADSLQRLLNATRLAQQSPHNEL
jgi:hypothetical protein